MIGTVATATHASRCTPPLSAAAMKPPSTISARSAAAAEIVRAASSRTNQATDRHYTCP